MFTILLARTDDEIFSVCLSSNTNDVFVRTAKKKTCNGHLYLCEVGR